MSYNRFTLTVPSPFCGPLKFMSGLTFGESNPITGLERFPSEEESEVSPGHERDYFHKERRKELESIYVYINQYMNTKCRTTETNNRSKARVPSNVINIHFFTKKITILQQYRKL